MINIKKYELKANDTTVVISKKEIESLDTITEPHGIIGQPRALKALKLEKFGA